MTENENAEIVLQDDNVIENTGSDSSESASHHHHHHRHHSKLYYKYRRIRHKLKKLFHSKKYLWLNVSVFGLMIIIIIAMIVSSSKLSQNKVPNVNSAVSTSETDVKTLSGYADIRFPDISDPQLIANSVVVSYLNSDASVSLSSLIDASGDRSVKDSGKAVTLSYEVMGLPESVNVVGASVEISENADLSRSLSYDFEELQTTLDIDLLKASTRYYYKITVALSNDSSVTYQGDFDTADTPRILKIDGAHNVRDIGTWRAENGKKIKQGMLIRGSEIDGAVEKNFTITDKGFSDMLTNLKITYDFDLRDVETGLPKYSALGATVKHKFYSAKQYGKIFRDGGKASMKDIFSDLANPENYPMYMHCTYGLDRTGTVCYILEALLGVSDEDLIREYELSALAYVSVNPHNDESEFAKFLIEFGHLDGSTSQEKAENYLLSCGVTKDEINTIKNILLED